MRTIREAKFGKSIVRLVESKSLFKAVVISGGMIAATLDGSDREEVWEKAVKQVGRSSPDFWGYDDARARFLANFPDGFSDPGYESSERAYKNVAATFINEYLPIEVARNASSAICELANKAFAKTNMVTPIEKTRVQALLRSDKGPAYLSAVADVALGDFGLAFSRLDTMMREHGQPSWPCATYLPFFWRQKTAMFLKPQITKDFADRVGHSFVRDYDARLNSNTYASLLDLAEECERELTSLSPKDRIDVQSFIWVVGDYPDLRTPLN